MRFASLCLLLSIVLPTTTHAQVKVLEVTKAGSSLKSNVSSSKTLAGTGLPPSAPAPQKPPSILVIFGDDIGYFNISAYNMGMMGYRTPNLDRVAQQGAIFTDYYAQQSCTAGRAAFITGQSPFRTGLLKVGLPGADLGLQAADPTIADLLIGRGYLTLQNGKNYLGGRNEFLPTVHGFDEFFGNFYHLNAEEEPENVDYPIGTGTRRVSGERRRGINERD
jgi:arylsulfatase A-like enzyme